MARDLSMYTEDSVANYNSAYQYQRGKGASDEDAHGAASGLLEMKKPTTTNTPAPTVNNNKTTTSSSNSNSSYSNSSNNYSNNSNSYSSSNNSNYSSNTSSSRNQTYNYDPNETLDTNKFGATDGKVVVKEGTAQQTGKPDYELNSDARMQEIVNNLNAYWQNNREFFKDRATFNQMFSYNSRSNEQKALLDSYWKRKEDESNIAKYTNADSLANGMKNAEITTDQMDLLRANNPELYAQRQKQQQDDINLRIANFATPADPLDNAELFQTLMKKMDIEPGDPYQIYDNWYNMAERLGVFKDSEELKSYQAQLNENHKKIESIISKYSANAGGATSAALSGARLQKALAPYIQREQNLQNSYTTILNGRNSNLAIANQSAQALAMQAQEDQRIFNQRLQGLGFAMQTASYRTPEQQAQLQLQVQQLSNDMSLLQQSKMNDLSLYNQYATAKLNNQLNSELTDLSVTDPVQQRANLNNVLSQYYAQWGDIIQRPQSQVVDDVLAYAQKNGVSVAEALKKNFIEPLQGKSEYKNAIASRYPSPYSSAGAGYSKITLNGKDYLLKDGEFVDASAFGGAGYTPVSSSKMSSGLASFEKKMQSLVKSGGAIRQGWCGEPVNDYLKSIGSDVQYDNALSTKLNSINSKIPKVGSIAIWDGSTFNSDAAKKYGHVAIVTGVDEKNGTITVLESNGQTKSMGMGYGTYKISNVTGFFDPSAGSTSDIQYSKTEPYSGVSRYTSNGTEINAGGWITSLENEFGSAARKSDAERKELYEAYGIDAKEYNEQKQRYADYVAENELKEQLTLLRDTAQELLDWNKDSGGGLHSGWADRESAEKGYWKLGPFEGTTKAKTGKDLFDYLSNNLTFQKYLDLKGNGASFGSMQQAEWDMLASSTKNFDWYTSDAVFESRLQKMIDSFDASLSKLGGASTISSDKEPNMKDMQSNNGFSYSGNVTSNGGMLTKYINGQMMISYDGGLSWY